MDKSLIRSEPFLGNTKTIVGDKMADLVLETLGKVYIKFGRSTRLLNDLFTLLDKSTTNTEDIRSKIIIVNSEQELRDLEYPGDGYFIYNTLTSILYLSYQREYVPLVNASDYKEGAFVKKSGDIMSGPLEIDTSSSPLIIASKALVNNLNVELLNGYGSDDFAKKRIDEIITGSWTFQNLCTSENNWIFKDNIRLYKDIVSSGSISTPEFASGFAGYGWRLDGDTNTLTIDYLVVRKAMKVFEMVINQISATNGSLWVSNSSKCASAKQPIIVNSDGVIYGETDSNNSSIKVEFDSSSKQFSNLRSGEYYIFEGVSGGTTAVTVNGRNLSTPSKFGTTTVFKKHYYLFYINDQEGLANSGLVNNMSDLYNAALSDTNPLSNYVSIYNTGLKDGLNVDVEFPAYVNNQLVYIKTYYKYFGAVSDTTINNNYWIIETDEESYPLFKRGDIVRCQKYSEGNIKYYDALVLTQLTGRRFLMQKATSVFDIYTEISYGDDGSVESMTEEINKTQYEKNTSEKLNDGNVLDNPAEKDNMIQIGNIENIDRQNAIYLTSTDDQSPYIDIISGLNRPDYSVIYNAPKYVKYVTTDPDTKHRKSYYVSEVKGGLLLGLMAITNDNVLQGIVSEILGEGNIYDVNDPTKVIGRRKYLYGYDYPTSVNSCLIQKEDGLDKYEYIKTTKVRLGRLDGIYNSMFGNNQPHGFGLYGENVFLTGEFYLNNGTSMADIANDYIYFGTSIEEINTEIGNLKNSLNEIPSIDSIYKDMEKAGILIDTNKNQVIIFGDRVGISTGLDEDGNYVFGTLFDDNKIIAERINLGRLYLTSGVLPDPIGTFKEISPIKDEVVIDDTEYNKEIAYNGFEEAKYNGKNQIVLGYGEGKLFANPFKISVPYEIYPLTITNADNTQSTVEEYDVKFSVFEPTYYYRYYSPGQTDYMGYKITPDLYYISPDTVQHYVSIIVEYEDSDGKTHRIISSKSKKDLDLKESLLNFDVIYDETLEDLDGYFSSFLFGGGYSYTSDGNDLKKSSFVFKRVNGVTKYTISVESGFLKKKNTDNHYEMNFTGGAGFLIGNPSIYKSDIDDGSTDALYYTTLRSSFYDENSSYGNIISGDAALTMSTYISSEGILTGSSTDQYVNITRDEFRVQYYGTGLLVNSDGIYYRSDDSSEWLILTKK